MGGGMVGVGSFFISEKMERGNFEEAKKACGFVKGGIIIIIMRERERNGDVVQTALRQYEYRKRQF